MNEKLETSIEELERQIKMEHINQNLFTKGGINQIRTDKNGVMAALNYEPNLFETSIERVF